jgi:hypothetical protein
MSILEALDQTSTQPKIYINGKERYITNIGIIMSICGLAVCLGLSSYFIVTFFQRTELSVYASRDTESIMPVANFSTFLFFNLLEYTSEGLTVPDPRVVTIVPTMWEIVDGEFNITTLEYEKCNNNSYDKEYRELVREVDVEKYLCIVPNKYNLTLYSDLSSTGNIKYLNFYISKCANTTENSNCYSDDYIEEAVKGMNLYYDHHFPSNYYKHENFGSPLLIKRSHLSHPIAYDFFKTYFMVFKQIVYESDSALIFQDPTRSQGFIIDDIQSTNQVEPKGTKVFVDGAINLIQYNFNNDSGDRFTRSYPKIQNLLANIGGIVNSILMICGFISQYISHQIMITDLSNILVHHTETPNKGTIDNKPPRGPKFKELSDKTNTQEGFRKATPKSCGIKRISIMESLLCSCCTRKSSSKRIFKQMEKVVRKHLSLDYLLRFMSDVEKLKRVLFTDKQVELFDNVKCPTLDEHLKKLTPYIKELVPRDDKCVQSKDTDEITRRILKYVN